MLLNGIPQLGWGVPLNIMGEMGQWRDFGIIISNKSKHWKTMNLATL